MHMGLLYLICSFLPVQCSNATSVKVEIKHDANVHTGVCGSHCKDENKVQCEYHYVLLFQL